MNKRILVTGAKGQLGKTIQELYSSNTLGLDFTFVSKSKLNIIKRHDLNSFFGKNKFDYCINCAAYTNVEQAEKTPEIAYKINAEGVKNLAEMCKTYHVALIHISTDYVFDGEKQEPYTVQDVPNPINEYGKSKLLGEKYIKDILNQYFIIRTSWLYSKKYGHNFYRTIVEKGKKGLQLSITKDQIGCPTNTINLSKFIIKVIIDKNRKFGIYHFTDNESMSWYDFAKKILMEHKLLNKIKLVEVENYRTFAKRPLYSVLAINE